MKITRTAPDNKSRVQCQLYAAMWRH